MTMPNLVCFAIGLVAGVAIGRVIWVPTRTPAQQQAMHEMRKLAEPPSTPKLPEPMPNYDATPIDDIRQNLRGLSLSQRQAVWAYESANLNRRGILNVLKALEQERSSNGG